MNTWFRKVGVGALALTIAGVLGGCNNGNGGGLIKLYFGINGSGNCSSVVVEVNLEEAGAVIARDGEGAPQCELASALDSAGCDISFSELENGDLRATISGCTIPGVSNLFSCLFEDVDISELQDTAFGQCTCTTQGCDGTPPVCISEDPDPKSCEDCDNGIDDDGNGLEDCEDPNCENAPECEDTTTTTSTSTSITIESTTSSTTTTTSSSTTTSSTLEPGLTCQIIFRLPDDVTLGSLQWNTDYSDAPGFMLGSGGQVECAGLVEGALFSANDVDDPSLSSKQCPDGLCIGIVGDANDGFSGPTDVAECTFKAFSTPAKSDFVITVKEAAAPNLQPVIPTPDVVIKEINCEGTVTTTTSETPTTTETTTTTEGGGVPTTYDVMFKLDSAGSDAVGALQIAVNYQGATGDFSGTGGTVLCSNQVTAEGTLAARNDDDANRVLKLNWINADGLISAPTNLSKCKFAGVSNDPPTPADFVITVEDAADANGDPISAAVSSTVTVAP